MNNTEIIFHFQGLLERYSSILSETDKQVIEKVCHILDSEPPDKIDWVLILKCIAQILAIGSQMHH